ncbi:MAG: SPOR domain-containing protein [Oxalobacteraceae bacterium]
MLKFIFWILLLANAALLALNLGYLGAIAPDGREPQRSKRQIHPEQLALLAPAAATANPEAVATAVPAPATAPVPAAVPTPTPAPALVACTEIGDFTLAQASRFEAQIAALGLGDRQSRRNVREVASYMVYIPPQGEQAGAQKKVEELRQRGVTNFFVMQDNSDLRWGISLGVFKTEAQAKILLAQLKQQGVLSARIGARSAATSKVMFQMRDLDPAGIAVFGRIAADFPQQQLRRCK